MSTELSKRFKNAVNNFIEKIKTDQNVIAVILCGSLSYDSVWEKSDVDMEVIIRDQKIETKSYCIDEDNLVLNVELIQRSDFKRNLEKSKGGLLNHSAMAKGKIIYTTDESLYEYYEEYKKIGEKDMERAIFDMSIGLIGYMHKIEKWIKVKNDLNYSRFYVLKVVELIAKIEVCRHLEIPTREAILQMKTLNPELYKNFYERPMAGKLSEEELYFLINEIDKYLSSNLEPIINVVKQCLGDCEIKTVTQICKYYKTYSHGIVDMFEYLSEKGIIQKLTQTIRITPKSKMAVEEIAFIMPNF